MVDDGYNLDYMLFYSGELERFRKCQDAVKQCFHRSKMPNTNKEMCRSV